MAIDPRQKELWLRELHLNGFVVLRNFLPVELVVEMHDELLPLLESEYAKASKDGFRRGRGAGRLALQVGPYADLFKGALADPRYRRHPVIEELVDAILGPESWKRGWTQVEAVWKGAHHMGWHTDQSADDTPDPAVQPGTIRVTYNIPLVDFTWASGATEFIPGSHRLSLDFQRSGDLRELANIYAVQPQLLRGDVLLRDGHTLHRGTPNLKDHPRPMLDQTYKKAAAG